ncbi:MAG: hypothetical protein U0903_04255 [Planctomycetales bacterium]
MPKLNVNSRFRASGPLRPLLFAWVGCCLICATTPAWAEPEKGADANPTTAGTKDPKNKKKPPPGKPLGSDSVESPAKGTTPEMKLVNAIPVEDFKKDRAAFSNLIISGKLSGDEDRKLLERGIKYHLARMTQPELRFKLYDINAQILRDLYYSHLASSFQVHDAYLEILVKLIDEMKLLQNNYYVRQNVAALLARLTFREKNEDVQLYEPAYRMLMAIMRDRKQIPAVKIHAVRGLTLYFHDASISPQTRNSIVQSFLNELTNENSQEPAYLLRIIESLGVLGQVEAEEGRRPIVVQKLMQIVVNDERDMLLRTASARAIGRLPLETPQGGLNIELIAIEFVKLGRTMADDWELAEQQDSWAWRYCFWNLYCAFHWEDDKEKQKGWGLLAQVEQKTRLASYKNITKEAFTMIVPLVNKVVLGSDKVDLPKHVEEMAKWTQAHTPRSDRIAPSEEPILTDAAPKKETPK